MILKNATINFLGDSITEGAGASCVENRFTDVMAREYGLFFLIAIFAGLPVRDFIVNKLHVNENLVRIVGAVALVALTALSVSYIATNGYNPFIYFNF